MTDPWQAGMVPAGSYPRQAGPAPAGGYPCSGCGARVQFAAGSNVMRCPYCGHETQISTGGRQVSEIPITELARLPRKPVGSIGAYTFACQQCAARTQSSEIATLCQFCGAPLVIDPAASGQIMPEAVLPFMLDREHMRQALRTWTSSRWFAPSALKKVTDAETTRGTYIPHWTFDAQTVSSFTGARGKRYRSGQSQYIRWHRVKGTARRNFDDVLVPASQVVAHAPLAALAPWPLREAAPYQPQYLAGYHALRYDMEPEAGFEKAKMQMARVIYNDVRRDIGGDVQRVESVSTQYFNVTFKLMLLPVWIATYLYAGKSWQILVNARTGEVHGQRPYSAAKIILAVAAALVVIAVAVWLYITVHRH